MRTDPTPELCALLDSRIALLDGAMGTMLHSRGVPLGTCFDGLNLTLKPKSYSAKL